MKSKNKAQRRRVEEEEQIIELESPSIVGIISFEHSKRSTRMESNTLSERARARKIPVELKMNCEPLYWKYIYIYISATCVCCALRMCINYCTCISVSVGLSIILCIYNFMCAYLCVCVCVVVLSTVNLCTVLYHG